jgi:hypothetical protein
MRTAQGAAMQIGCFVKVFLTLFCVIALREISAGDIYSSTKIRDELLSKWNEIESLYNRRKILSSKQTPLICSVVWQISEDLNFLRSFTIYCDECSLCCGGKICDRMRGDWIYSSEIVLSKKLLLCSTDSEIKATIACLIAGLKVKEGNNYLPATNRELYGLAGVYVASVCLLRYIKNSIGPRAANFGWVNSCFDCIDPIAYIKAIRCPSCRLPRAPRGINPALYKVFGDAMEKDSDASFNLMGNTFGLAVAAPVVTLVAGFGYSLYKEVFSGQKDKENNVTYYKDALAAYSPETAHGLVSLLTKELRGGNDPVLIERIKRLKKQIDQMAHVS